MFLGEENILNRFYLRAEDGEHSILGFGVLFITFSLFLQLFYDLFKSQQIRRG